MHWMDGWHVAWMWIFWIVVLGIGLAIVIALVRAGGAGPARTESAEEVLRQRFARGEIDREELEERLEALRDGG